MVRGGIPNGVSQLLDSFTAVRDPVVQRTHVWLWS